MKVQIFYSTGLGNSNGIQICQTMRTRARARKFLTLDPSSRESYQLLSQIWRLYTMVILYIQTIINRVGIGWTLNAEVGFWKIELKIIVKSLNLELIFREFLHATSYHLTCYFLTPRKKLVLQLTSLRPSSSPSQIKKGKGEFGFWAVTKILWTNTQPQPSTHPTSNF